MIEFVALNPGQSWLSRPLLSKFGTKGNIFHKMSTSDSSVDINCHKAKIEVDQGNAWKNREIDGGMSKPSPEKNQSVKSDYSDEFEDDQSDDDFLDAVENQSIEELRSKTGLSLDEIIDEAAEIDDVANDIDYPPAEEAMRKLYSDIDEGQKAVTAFLNNKFHEAEDILLSGFKKTLYHSHGYGIVFMFRALMSFDPHDIKEAHESLIISHQMAAHYMNECKKKIKPDGLAKSIMGGIKSLIVSQKPSSASFSPAVDDQEKPDLSALYNHSRLLFAEALILKSILGIILLDSSNLIDSDNQQNAKISASSNSRGHFSLSGLASGVGMIAGFVSQVLSLRTAALVYGDLYKKMREMEDSNPMDRHLVSGIHTGIGVIHLLFGLLPNRALKVVEFLGFLGIKDIINVGKNGSLVNRGLALLSYHHLRRGVHECGDDNLGETPPVRDFILDLILLAYHIVLPMQISFISPFNPGFVDLKYVPNSNGIEDGCFSKFINGILDNSSKRAPNGALFLFFRSRLDLSEGNWRQALNRYSKIVEIVHAQSNAYQSRRKSMSTQIQVPRWAQLKHICVWDMAFTHFASLDWEKGRKCMELLERESRWSPIIYRYLLGCAFLMEVELSKEERTESENEEMVKNVDNLFESLPGLMRRIAGKRIPLEKYVARKARKYFLQKKRLFLPIFEYSGCIYSLFRRMGQLKDQENGNSKANIYLEKSLAIVNEEIGKFPKFPDHEKFPYLADDILLSALIKGHLYKQSSDYNRALMEWEINVIEAYEGYTKKGTIVLDEWIVPYAKFEIGKIHLERCIIKYNKLKANIKEHRMIEYRDLQNDLAYTRSIIDPSKKKVKRFSMENSLNFRKHVAVKRCDEISRNLEHYADEIFESDELNLEQYI